MHTYRLWVLAVVGLSVGASHASAQLDVSIRRPILSPNQLDRVGYNSLWDLPLPTGNDSVVAAHLLDENLYVTTHSGRVYAVHADTGLLRWVQRLDEVVLRDRSPTRVQTPTGDGPVVFVTHSAIHVYDAYSGDVVREFDLPFPAGGGAVADRHLMAIGGAEGMLYALHWSADPTCAALVRWEVLVKGAVTTTPALRFGRLYVVSNGGVVYCIRPADKHLFWAYRTRGEVTGELYVDESGVYVACNDRRLYVLDSDTGNLVSEYRLPGLLFDAPQVAQRTCYQYSQGAGLYAFDVDSRERLWINPSARRLVARAAEDVVLQSLSGALLFTDNRSGQVRSTAALPDGVLVAHNTRDAVLYLVSQEGDVSCAAPKRYPYLRREAVMRARAGLSTSPRDAKDTPAANAPLGSGAAGLPGAGTRDPLRSDGE